MSAVGAALEMLPAVLPALAGAAGAFSGAKFVQEGQRGVKLRFGKVVRRRGAVRVIPPGFVFVIPTIEHLSRVHVRTRTINLPTQEVTLTDRTTFRVGGVVQVRVEDTPEAIYAVLFGTDGVEPTTSDYVTGVLRRVVAQMRHEELLGTAADIDAMVSTAIEEQLRHWGLVLEGFRLTDCSPTPETSRALLIAAEAQVRTGALLDAWNDLEGKGRPMSPTVAAAIIGVPVSAALGAVPGEPVPLDDDE